jgi:hypothetical protein
MLLCRMGGGFAVGLVRSRGMISIWARRMLRSERISLCCFRVRVGHLVIIEHYLGVISISNQQRRY